MKKNNYMSFSCHTLEVLYFLMKETLTVMSSQYSDLALSGQSDLNSYHNAVQVLHNEFNQLNEALQERGIVPPRGKFSADSVNLMPSSEIHY